MSKVKLTKINIFFLAFLCHCIFVCFANGQIKKTEPYLLKIYFVDKDTFTKEDNLKLQTKFTTATQCLNYITTLTAILNLQGYPTASIDSIWQDTTTCYVQLYLGKQYKWIQLQADSIDEKAISQSGFLEKKFNGKLLNMQQLQSVQLRILNFYLNNGYPFAQVYLDNIHLNNQNITAQIKVKKGYPYVIDSIRVYGKAKISKFFLQHYLNITNGSIYSKEKLQQVSNKILEIPFLKEAKSSDVTMLGAGAILNLYLMPKKSSQFNFIVGLTPAPDSSGKFVVTADVNLNLKNALNKGETIAFNWQQLQPQSPRLNLEYTQPYILNSNFGSSFLFNLLKKDSSYLQLNGQLGFQYILSANQFGKFYVQWQNNILLANGVDTNYVIRYKQLPVNVDVSSTNFGIDFNIIKTDYKPNPRAGNEFIFSGALGIKNIKKNSTVLDIKDALFNYASLYDSVKLRSYQFKIKLIAAHYFALGKQTTFKAQANIGYYNSPNIFKNELFQIGGFQLLRGFNEESIYATQYAVSTAECRLRSGLNSYFFIFSDAGIVKNKYQNINLNTNFLSAGLGMALETKLGFLNISYAIGKRSDMVFNLSQASKIHFGYVNYF